MLGTIALGTWLLGIKWADIPAMLLLGAAGGGTAIALYEEVERQREVWGWRGIVRAMRHPSAWFWAGAIGHLPQLFIAVGLAFYWRLNRKA